MHDCYRQNVFLWIIAMAAPLIGPAMPAALAQTELKDWQDNVKKGAYAEPAKSDRRVTFTGIAEALKTGNFANPGDVQAFAEMYEKRYFPLVTHPEIRGTREDPIILLRSNFYRVPRDSDVANKLTDITLAYMLPIARDSKRHPAARESAILAIGEVKSPKAVDALVQLIKDNKLHPMFRVAAMAGLAHLSEQGILTDPAVAAPIAALMANYAKATLKNPPDWVRWMRGQAADVLGAIGSVGADGKVPDALLTMVEDKELPLLQRGKAARALGRLKEIQANLPDRERYIRAFASFGSEALAEKDPQGRNLPGDARRIWSVSRDFVDGLAPLKSASPTPKVVNDMYDAMEKLLKAASNVKNGRPPTEEDLKPEIASAKGVLDAAAQANK